MYRITIPQSKIHGTSLMTHVNTKQLPHTDHMAITDAYKYRTSIPLPYTTSMITIQQEKHPNSTYPTYTYKSKILLIITQYHKTMETNSPTCLNKLSRINLPSSFHTTTTHKHLIQPTQHQTANRTHLTNHQNQAQIHDVQWITETPTNRSKSLTDPENLQSTS
ncbi:unnamed protein product [Adineta ricciae]|uniref:Uncharacterized protein n=1 Tax=Adineta ricciae TaxID=249248 RepID=A0A815X5B9_ADIRI|nr:unnamed protein product [Adineta ricciae]CAF1631299.1 unnamed protein product [Adineta ricciae]